MASLSRSACLQTLLTTRLAASVTESSLESSLEWRLPVLTNGVGDLDLDRVRGLLGDLDMSLGGGFGGLGGGVFPRFGAEGRLSRGSSMGSSEGMQIMCLNLGGDGAGVGGGWRGGGG